MVFINQAFLFIEYSCQKGCIKYVIGVVVFINPSSKYCEVQQLLSRYRFQKVLKEKLPGGYLVSCLCN